MKGKSPKVHGLFLLYCHACDAVLSEFCCRIVYSMTHHACRSDIIVTFLLKPKSSPHSEQITHCNTHKDPQKSQSQK